MCQVISRVCAVLTAVLALGGGLWGAEYNTAVKRTPLMSWMGASKPASLATTESAVVAKQVDQLLTEDLAAADDSNKVIAFGKRAADEVFLRRIYLDFIGRNPTPDEVTAFVLDPSPDKRGKVIDRLLDDPLRRKLGPLLARRDYVSPQRRSCAVGCAGADTNI